MPTTPSQNGFTVKAYRGDAKTLLAFNLPKAQATRLAGFTIQYAAGGKGPCYLSNNLRFADPSKHVQDATQPANSSLNAPLHKFRWLHVPGALNQGTRPFFGPYTYTVTPRYFDATGSMQAIDRSLGASVTVEVGRFQKGGVRLGFARGFMQSQAFVHHFGPAAVKRPAGLLFDTAQVAGKNSAGATYTYADQYAWLGFTARELLFQTAQEVLADPALSLDVFAYDLNEPDLLKLFLQLAAQGRMRLILDNAALHHNATGTLPEDQFEQAFRQAATGRAAIQRGKFSRFAHDKQLIVSDATGPLRVLTGSTNFSVTGLYVNSNHVVIFDDRGVARKYSEVFNTAWAQNVNGPAFAKSPDAAGPIPFAGPALPKLAVAYSPHPAPVAAGVLQGIVDRVAQEKATTGGNVLFAVMAMDAKSTGPVFPALRDLHRDQSIFSYGITDTPDGIALYKPGTSAGLLVTGKPLKSQLPPPFEQVPSPGLGHQIHHKFVICGFNRPDAVVYCGSSNLALGGEQQNGDNLIALHDPDIATAFALEALGLVDHFHFLDKVAVNAKASGQVPQRASPTAVTAATKSSSKQQQSASAGWFLGTSDAWTKPYFDPADLKSVDRLLFG